jgi:hypothetical protein
MLNLPKDRAAYRILSSFFGPDDHLYGEGDCIVFDGEPNEEMEPLNEMAQERLNRFYEKLDGFAKAVAAKNGRSFAGRSRSLDEAVSLASQDARRNVPLMGNDPKVQKQEFVNIERIGPDSVPQTSASKKGGDLKIGKVDLKTEVNIGKGRG